MVSLGPSGPVPPQRAPALAVRRVLCSVTKSMARVFALAVLGFASACGGEVRFGTDLLEGDGGFVVDEGMPDLGMLEDVGPDVGLDAADLGDVGGVDGGCIPVDLPDTPPQSWPFLRDEATYRGLVWDWTGVSAGCARGGCHADGEVPFIPTEAGLSSRLDDAIDGIWPYLRDAPPLDRDAPSGALWRHMPGHPDFISPTMVGAAPARLEAARLAATACAVARVVANPPDAGAGCGMDDAGPCYCTPDAGMLMTEYCAP